MTNTVLFKTMLDRYNAMSFTHEYIFGWEEDSTIYASFTNANVLPFVCCLDKASRGQGYSIRFKPTKAQKAIFKTCNTFALCSVKFFNETVSNSKYNKGEIFEKLITEYFGQTWEKDHVPFTDGGDATIDGIAYQIKFEKATFTNEKTLMKLMERG